MKNIFLLSFCALLSGLFQPSCSKSIRSGHTLPHSSGFITVADSRIYYETTGKGPPLVLLHGGLLDRRMWDQQVTEFARNHQVITCDQRGHGLTVDGDSSYFQHEAVRMLLDSLHIRRAVIGGLSMGGMVATDFAIVYPEYTEKLILFVPGLSGGWNVTEEDSVMMQRFDLMGKALEARDTLMAAEYFIQNWFDGPVRRPDQTDMVQRRKAVQMAYNTFRVHQNLHWVRAAEPKSITRLSKIICPVLIIVSEKDNPIIRRVADILQRDIPKTERVLIKGVAHMPNMERPAEVNAILARFLKDN